jgi:hypothetical protein
MLDRVVSMPETPITASSALDAAPPKSEKTDGGFGFFDLLDMINPLQHIPVVGTIYRAITGDEIRSISRIIGGAVFGGPMGAAGGLMTAVIEDGTGKDPGELALSFVSGQDGGQEKAARAVAHYEQSKRAGLRIEKTVEYNA